MCLPTPLQQWQRVAEKYKQSYKQFEATTTAVVLPLNRHPCEHEWGFCLSEGTLRSATKYVRDNDLCISNSG